MMRGALFDADGTLLDSMYVWDTIGEDYLRSIGYEPHEDLNERFRTLSLYQAACYYRSEYGVPLSTDEIMQGVNDRIEHLYRDVVQPKPGVPEFLERLRKAGVRLCITTATDRYLIEAAMRRCGLLGCFSEIFTCTSVGHGKDEPDIYREAVRCLGIEKREAVVFEDSLYAIRTAKRDGFAVAGVFDASEKNQAEVRRLSDCYITDFADDRLIPMLSEMMQA